MPELQRLRMSYDEWWAMPDWPKSEWVDGEVVVGVPPTADHMDASYGLAASLKRDLPDLRTYQEVGVQLPHNRVRVPDVMVVTARPEDYLVTEAPVLVVEVLSPTTRSEDTVRKSTEYLAGGISQYWLVDPAAHTLEAFANVDGGWEPVLRLDDRTPKGEVEVAPYGVVRLDLTTILAGLGPS